MLLYFICLLDVLWLFDLVHYVPVNIFSVMSERVFLGIKSVPCSRTQHNGADAPRAPHVAVSVMWPFLVVSWVGLQCVNVAFPHHTQLRLNTIRLWVQCICKCPNNFTCNFRYACDLNTNIN